MKTRYLYALLVIVFAGIGPLNAQPNVHNGVVYATIEEANAARRRDQANAALKNMVKGANNAADALSDLDPSRNLNPVEFYNRSWVEDNLRVKKEQKLPFTAFLKQKNTGIFILMPEEKCGTIGTGKTEIFISPESAYYWFDRKVHFQASADLGFKNGNFETGIGLNSIGYLIQLGNVALESVDINNSEARKLSEIIISPERSKMLDQRTEAPRTVPAKQEETYLLRSAVYKGQDRLIAFRVVSTDMSGNVLILWKMIENVKSKKI